jgi:hypothetical protein
MPSLRLWPAGLALGLAAATAGCTQYWRDSGVYDIAGQPGLLLDIQNYYHEHAVEEGGRCPRPLMEGVTASQVLEEDADHLVVDLRYAYRDVLNDDDDCDRDARFRWLRCSMFPECRGYGERTFTIAKRADGAAITDMSGERRR